MSNLPGDFSVDSQPVQSAVLAELAEPKQAAESPPLKEIDLHDKVSEEDSDDEEDTYKDGLKLRDLSGSEVHDFPGLKREKWWQLWRPRHAPPPPKGSLDDAEVIPLAYVSVLSKLTFSWVTPIMTMGYQRPLQATDLWKMDPSRESGNLSARFLERLAHRQQQAEAWNASLKSRRAPRISRVTWAYQALLKRSLPEDLSAFGSTGSFTERQASLENEWRQRSGRRAASITWALNDVMTGFWAGGFFKVAGDTAQLMSPLVVKSLIRFSQKVYDANQDGSAPPNIGRGIGMAIGLWALTIMQSICQHQFFFRSMAIGVLARATLISAVYQRAVSLTAQGRAQHPNGKIINHVSSDISRIDYCAQWFHAIWTAPIQLLVTLILLLVQIGPSALVGFSLFVILAPLQTWFMKISFIVRKKSMVWTDARAKLLRELLSSMQIIKVFTYEVPFLKRLQHIRRKEMLGVRSILIIRAANQAMAFSIPTIAAVLSFVTYASTHNGLDPALIFTSLAFFNLLRQPLMFLPRALSTLTDAQNAVDRLSEVFEAEVLPGTERVAIDKDLDVAVRVQHATFKWVAESSMESEITKEKPHLMEPTSTSPLEQVPRHSQSSQQTLVGPFTIPDLYMEIPRGRLVAIVGSVGSGKSSLLQGLIGEMNTTHGSVQFGGNLAYCQQNAWIQNASLRDNVVFGQAWDEHRYWQAVRDASLIADLEILPDGDLTEIGEKGVNLSGGQKQRVNIARALYFDAEVILFDDPLSAVDAHVGKALFENAILGLRRRGKTVILVTHALHFLSSVDYIYTLHDGRVVEEGSFNQLITASGPFAYLMANFGGVAEKREAEEAAAEEEAIEEVPDEKHKEAIVRLTRRHMGKAAGTGKLEGRLMVSETRKTGSVGRRVYGGYLRAGQAHYTFPLTLLFGVVMQSCQVMSTVWLTYWEETKFGRTYSFYEGIYAMLGLSQALFTFAMGTTLGVMSYWASNNLHKQALRNVFACPMSVFDTQPLGRILGVFGKDIDTIDNQLADSLRMLAMSLCSLLGSVIIITVYFHYFIVVIFVVGMGYWYFSMFYRTSARELKRLDSLLRGLLYSHFSESLSGLGTIRAYGETKRFIRDNQFYTDLEDRAYLITATNQRWLSVRLDFLGACLVFALAVMAAKGGGGLSASQIALCLTYMTSVTQIFGMMTRQTAEVENNMNAVERVMWYADGTRLEQEAPRQIPDSTPPDTWPTHGCIEFKDVVMAYRKGLAPVLKGINLKTGSGEKIGIIGRTGAGKTSITIALYRLAELSSGSIEIDGIDISKIGLEPLRSRVAIIPQDPVLFSGTLRSNLDPFDLHDDARLYDAMQRACLSEMETSRGNGQNTTTNRFTLDTVIEDEGSNLSVGERSLVSLARALVKDSKIVVLDEATAAVDMETDAKIQRTIHREFKAKTLLCIAHRLRTIISWDRILVMDAGQIAEFDTPLNLFDSGGQFRSMCDRSSIQREDIVKARVHDAEL
ncbi:P-loop containing nucleoside triphosphate hydrolase protein [Naematelia encephala]|uniref:p-loop containing nucleoside triphosphate hydrolase protein n=1 Tax=Naematelia encephala TaxID=71784 RepID=A0A1Y2AYL4_9TREE|nr:P-loop containing nucleoside triphosphate hydrolase protein [Naematelia encephala]